MKLDENKALLIDDNEIQNFFNKDVLEEFDSFKQIEVIDHPVKVIDYFKSCIEKNIDIPGFIVVDVKMPDMDGFELIDEIDELFDENELELAPVFVILTTSNHKRDYEQFDKTPLAQRFLTKPLSAEKLKPILEEFDFI